MTLHRGRWTLAALAAAALSSGCSGASSARTSSEPRLSDSDRAAIAKARADSAVRPYTRADIAFMSNMIGHHAQAISISRWAPTHGANASVRILAERIINGQEDDIVLMKQWLRDRLQPIPAADGGAASGHHAHHMPGMLTEAQLGELDQARGKDFDRLFLTYMIQHHLGAVTMVKELFSSYGAGQDHVVFKFASDVNVDQSTEIARMEKMLAELQP
jgi:uncharacterized protein (DUF305 family)